jgi:hypothetical protein
MDRRLLEYRPEIEALDRHATQAERRLASAARDETERAVGLLERTDDELECYLVALIDGAGPMPHRQVTTALADILARAARRLLRPMNPSQVAAEGRVFGLELEGLSPEDQAFELARQFVRFASEAARRASDARSTGAPEVAAERAAALAARTLAPGLLPACAGDGSGGAWLRRGARLVVLDP